MRPRIWLPWWLWLLGALAWLLGLALLACVWMAWACIVLPFAGLFLAIGDRKSASRFAATLNWSHRNRQRPAAKRAAAR